MLSLNSLIFDVNAPVPLPSTVLLSVVVGFWFMLQQTPLAVTSAPPSDVTLPPLIAADSVISVTGNVTTLGFSGSGLHETNILAIIAMNKYFFII